MLMDHLVEGSLQVKKAVEDIVILRMSASDFRLRISKAYQAEARSISVRPAAEVRLGEHILHIRLVSHVFAGRTGMVEVVES
jgi:hypothetical protein